MTVFIVLVFTAFVTSIISAILGMAGGVMLLAVMLSFMSHGDAIPTHAVVQIASNGTRAVAFMKNIDRTAFMEFVGGVVFGGAIGFGLLWWLGEPKESEPWLKMLVGVYILLATWVPRKRPAAEAKGSWWDFPLIGLVAGAAALTVGAVGPLIAPVFARRDFVKERLIATKATCQLATHFMKIPAFLFLRDLDLGRLGLLALLMVAVVVPGTLIGKRILADVSERHFRIAFKAALTLAGTKVMLVDGVYSLLAGGA